MRTMCILTIRRTPCALVRATFPLIGFRGRDLMNQVSVSGRNAVYFGIPRPRFAYRVTFGGNVRVTTDPVEVARIRRAYPAARVEIIPVA
jgi:hypothetical protein